MLILTTVLVIIHLVSVIATPTWDGEYADYLNVMVTYPYKIHAGRLVGVTKYESGPEGIDTGTLVKYELESGIFKEGDKWVMRHGDGDDAKTFVISDEFARFVIEPAEKNSGCVKQGDNDDKDLENKKDDGDDVDDDENGKLNNFVATADQVKAVFAAAIQHARDNANGVGNGDSTNKE